MADKGKSEDKSENIPHGFSIDDVQHGTVYTATSSTFPSQSTPNLLAMGLSYDEARHHYRCTGTPGGSIAGSSATNFPLYHHHEDTGTIIAVGPLVGQPLRTWMRNQFTAGTVWEYDINGNLTGLKEKAKKLLYLMGAALAPIHERGGYVGDIVNQSRIDSDFTRITFDKFEEHSSQLIGLKRDIADFKQLIINFETVDNISPTSNPKNYAIVDLFKAVCDAAQTCSDPAEVIKLSYFLCHSPLSWNYQQRIDFVFAFYSFREQASSVAPNSGARARFDSVVSFTRKETSIAPNWQTIIPPNTIFWQLLQYHSLKNVYAKSIGLLPYHRSCYFHYNKEEISQSIVQVTPHERIDEQLMRWFPDAIPKAWYELCINRNRLGINIVKELKAQPGCLHYSKFP